MRLVELIPYSIHFVVWASRTLTLLTHCQKTVKLFIILTNSLQAKGVVTFPEIESCM